MESVFIRSNINDIVDRLDRIEKLIDKLVIGLEKIKCHEKETVLAMLNEILDKPIIKEKPFIDPLNKSLKDRVKDRENLI